MWLNGLTAEHFGAGLQKWEKGYGIWKEGTGGSPLQGVSSCLSSTREQHSSVAPEGSLSGGAAKGKAKEKEKKKNLKRGYCAVEKWSKNEKGVTRMRRCGSASSSTEAQCKCAACFCTECGKGRVSIQISFHNVFLLSSLLICRSLRQITFTGTTKSGASP